MGKLAEFAQQFLVVFDLFRKMRYHGDDPCIIKRAHLPDMNVCYPVVGIGFYFSLDCLDVFLIDILIQKDPARIDQQAI